MKTYYSAFIFAVLATLLSGCATSFQGNTLSAVEHFPDTQPKKSVAVNLLFTGKLNGEAWKENDRHNTVYLEELCVDRLNKSGLFSIATAQQKTADLNLQVAMINEKKTSSGRQVLTAVTLFIIPYKSTDTFRLLAVVKDATTGEKKTIELEQRVSHWQQLFLAPFSLFKNPTNQMEECRNRLFDNLCLEIYNSGLLD